MLKSSARTTTLKLRQGVGGMANSGFQPTTHSLPFCFFYSYVCVYVEGYSIGRKQTSAGLHEQGHNAHGHIVVRKHQFQGMQLNNWCCAWRACMNAHTSEMQTAASTCNSELRPTATPTLVLPKRGLH